MTPGDVEGRTLRDLSLLRNTIYARHGHRFDKKWLADHFAAEPWYTPRERKDEDKPSAQENKNLDVIARYDGGLQRVDLLRRVAEIKSRAAAGHPFSTDALELRLLSERLGEWQAGEDVVEGERTALEDPRLLDRLLSLATLHGMSIRDLRLLRNTIYARHGRDFVSPSLKAYFAPMAWYKIDPAYSDARLTEIDKKNALMIRSEEDARGGAWNELDETELHKGQPRPFTVMA